MNVLRQEIRTGLLVVVSLAILFFVVLYLGAPGVFVPQKTYYIYVENAAGLKQGADVALAGRKIGQVVQLFSPVEEEKRPAPQYETMVEVRVVRTAKVYNNAKAAITSASLLGEYFIDFTAGTETAGVAKGMSTFIGGKPNSLTDAVPLLLSKIEPVIKEATVTFQSLQKTADNISKLTADNGDLPRAIAEFREVGANLKDATAPSGPLRTTLDNVSKLTAENGKITTTLNNLQDLTGPNSDFAKAMANAQKFTDDLQKNRDFPLALANARKATDELNTTLNSLRFQFATIAGNLEQASDTVKRQPWRLIWPTTKTYEEKKPTEPKPAERKPGKKSGRGE